MILIRQVGVVFYFRHPSANAFLSGAFLTQSIVMEENNMRIVVLQLSHVQHCHVDEPIFL